MSIAEGEAMSESVWRMCEVRNHRGQCVAVPGRDPSAPFWVCDDCRPRLLQGKLAPREWLNLAAFHSPYDKYIDHEWYSICGESARKRPGGGLPSDDFPTPDECRRDPAVGLDVCAAWEDHDQAGWGTKPAFLVRESPSVALMAELASRIENWTTEWRLRRTLISIALAWPASERAVGLRLIDSAVVPESATFELWLARASFTPFADGLSKLIELLGRCSPEDRLRHVAVVAMANKFIPQWMREDSGARMALLELLPDPPLGLGMAAMTVHADVNPCGLLQWMERNVRRVSPSPQWTCLVGTDPETPQFAARWLEGSSPLREVMLRGVAYSIGADECAVELASSPRRRTMSRQLVRATLDSTIHHIAKTGSQTERDLARSIATRMSGNAP